MEDWRVANSTQRQFNDLVQRLSEILGPRITQRLVEEAFSSGLPGARLLPGDGLEPVSARRRRRAMALIAEYIER